MRKNIVKVFFILTSGLLLFSACDFNNLKERIVISDENQNQILPEAEPAADPEPEPESEPVVENEPEPEIKKLVLLQVLRNCTKNYHMIRI